MHAFPRSEEPFLSVERTAVDGTCRSAAGASSPTTGCSARVAGGTSGSARAASHRSGASRGPMFGSYVPLGLEIARGTEG